MIPSSGHISKVKDTSLSLINPELNYRSKFGKNGFLPSTNSLTMSGESYDEYLTLYATLHTRQVNLFDGTF